jgi:hypothetical protein
MRENKRRSGNRRAEKYMQVLPTRSNKTMPKGKNEIKQNYKYKTKA